MPKIEHIKVVMVRDDMREVPQYPLHSPYRFGWYQPGDEGRWAEVETSAGEFPSSDAALDHFAREFAAHPQELRRRMLFLYEPGGRAVGTCSAWHGTDIGGVPRGRIHWVGIVPEFQGRRLAKPLMTAAMNRMAQLHDQAYLTTQTTSFKAIKIYLDFGFSPYVKTVEHERGWALLADLLGHPALATYH
jgi:ribosomal protein S18 acetylase RimI-like enzyme